MRHARLGWILAGMGALGLGLWAEGCLFAPDECSDLLKCPGKGSGGGASTGTGTGGDSTSSGVGVSGSTTGATSTGTGGPACVVNGDCTVGTTPTCDLVTHTCISCSDGIKNGQELGADCGGDCQKCNGEVCADNGNCASTHCDDGLCCDTACTGTCQACNIAGTVGICSNVPIGSTDPVTCNNAPSQVCNGAGVCKKDASQKCGADSDCASSRCFAGLCRVQTGGVCADSVACGSGLCTAGKCADCSVDNQCTSAVCAAPICKVPGGAPCAIDAECAANKCQLGLCLLDNQSTCTVNADCKSGFCNSNICSPCVSNGSCSGNATCGTTYFGVNTCERPSGAYCTSSAQCAGVGSTKCVGFPGKCI